jgi:hypothetical protein
LIVPFNDLPLTGLDSLTISLEVFAPASVWVDDLRLYHLAFTDDERTLFAQMSSLASLHIGKGRVAETLNILEGYWPRLLAECIPNVEELVAQQAAANPAPQPAPPTEPTAPSPPEEPKKTTIMGRIKSGLKFW